MTDTILHPMGIETSSGVSGAFGCDNTLIGMFVNISAVSGILPTLIVQLQHSPNDVDWYNISGIVNSSALGIISLTAIYPSTTQYIAESIRASWTIAGVGASFTFSVEVETT